MASLINNGVGGYYDNQQQSRQLFLKLSICAANCYDSQQQSR